VRRIRAETKLRNLQTEAATKIQRTMGRICMEWARRITEFVDTHFGAAEELMIDHEVDHLVEMVRTPEFSSTRSLCVCACINVFIIYMRVCVSWPSRFATFSIRGFFDDDNYFVSTSPPQLTGLINLCAYASIIVFCRCDSSLKRRKGSACVGCFALSQRRKPCASKSWKNAPELLKLSDYVVR
jgi:hypothetical protein